jgi:Na+-translocating ferredoxin:NAD+ oxidoreductase RnfC subunit
MTRIVFDSAFLKEMTSELSPLAGVALLDLPGVSRKERRQCHFESPVAQSAGNRGRDLGIWIARKRWCRFSGRSEMKTVLDHPRAVRYVVCNAAEGEPGTFKDRYLLRRNPYAVLEGLLIAAHVVGTKTIYIGIKADFEPEIRRLTQAIHEMRTAGLISAINIEISPGPVEYLFGEEKALLNQIKVGLPLPREAHYPPYEKGLF